MKLLFYVAVGISLIMLIMLFSSCGGPTSTFRSKELIYNYTNQSWTESPNIILVDCSINYRVGDTVNIAWAIYVLKEIVK